MPQVIVRKDVYGYRVDLKTLEPRGYVQVTTHEYALKRRTTALSRAKRLAQKYGAVVVER